MAKLLILANSICIIQSKKQLMLSSRGLRTSELSFRNEKVAPKPF